MFTRRGKFPKGLPKWTLMLDSLVPNSLRWNMTRAPSRVTTSRGNA